MKRTLIWWLPLLLGCHRPASQPPQAGAPVIVAAGAPACTDAADCERACQAGTAGACVEAGRLYEFGHAGPRDAARAFPLYQRSCALGNAAGCFNSGVLLEAGRGTSQDTQRAAALFRQVCRMGSKTGCERADRLLPIAKPNNP